jgi:putative FmdB family regulatory protein
MPLYEFICQNCAEEFELRVSFSQTDLQQECPACGSKNSKKKLSQFSSTAKNTTPPGNSSPGCGSGGRFT